MWIFTIVDRADDEPALWRLRRLDDTGIVAKHVGTGEFDLLFHRRHAEHLRRISGGETVGRLQGREEELMRGNMAVADVVDSLQIGEVMIEDFPVQDEVLLSFLFEAVSKTEAVA